MLFMGTSFICLFIFMMQFLWKYVDEMVGKGLEISVLAKFFFYSALTLVPVSLPLAVLLAALITFGNFGERFELLAMKAAGISLLKIMRPLIVFILFVSGVSFFFQNVIGPEAYTKLYTLIISMKQKSPELDIPEGVFYDEIEGYNLYVKHKNRKTGMLYDVLIYNFEKGFENAQIIKADSGRLEMTADKQHLYLHLYDGEQFENLKSQNMNQRNVPYRREAFREKHAIIEFDSDFNMVDAGIMSNQSMSKNMRMLQAGIDSMTVQNDSIGRTYFNEAMSGTYKVAADLNGKDTLKIQQASPEDFNVDSLFNAATLAQKQKVLATAVSRATSVGSDWSFKSYNVAQTDTSLRRHMTSWHEKLTLSVACLIFFFIGAPLGAIIKKGGLGTPLVVSVLLFIFYFIIDNAGYKMARDGKIEVWQGIWLSSMALLPLGAFFTYKAVGDSAVFNPDAYMALWRRITGRELPRTLELKELVMSEVEPAEALRLLNDEAEAEQRVRAVLDSRPHWRRRFAGRTVAALTPGINSLVDYLSNSRDAAVINLLNRYPFRATPKRFAAIEETTRALINHYKASDNATENQA